MTKVYLSLGSNMGEREAYLKEGRERLADHPQIQNLHSSSIYQTSPVGGVVQDDFLNQVVALETDLAPQALLDFIHEIEQACGRVRLIHWGPRTLDIDILFFGEETIDTETLKLPHHEIFNRLFVLQPLAQIMPADFYRKTEVHQAIDQLKAKGHQQLEIYQDIN